MPRPRTVRGLPLAASATLLLAAPAPAAAQAPTLVDKAVMRHATGSSIEKPGLEARYATDGNAASRWSSAFRDGQWLQVDLGAKRPISAVDVTWGSAYASRYDVATSLDGVRWWTTGERTADRAGTFASTFAQRDARYVRVTAIARGTTMGISIADVKVRGPVDGVKEVEHGVGLPAVALTSAGPDLAPARGADGDPATRWSSAAGDGQWWQVDLGARQQVGTVSVAWHADHAARYRLSTSLDGVGWTAVAEETAAGAGERRTHFPTRAARHVRLTALDRGTPGGVSFSELRVLGPAPGMPTAVAESRTDRPAPVIGIAANLRWASATDLARDAARLRDAGVQYVREDFHWHVVEQTPGTYTWSRYDAMVRELARRGIRIVAIPNSPPPWATASTSTPPLNETALTGYIGFIRRAIERYGSNGTFWTANPDVPRVPITIWDIWNEPYYGPSWTPGPDPGAYARMFKAVAQALRPVDPAARFMAEVETFAFPANPLPSRPFLHAMFDAVPDLGRYMDLASAHPYTWARSPAACAAPVPSRGAQEDWRATTADFCRIRDVRRTLDARGAGATGLWITELGFTTAPAVATNTWTEGQQAHHVRDVFTLLREWDVVDGLLWFRYKSDERNPADPEHFYGLVHADGSPKPAWAAFVDEVRRGL